MSRCTTLIAFTLMASFLYGQNEPFENWENVNGYDVPVGWQVNNDYPTHPCSVRDSNAAEGNTALRLRSFGGSFEGWAPGYASRTYEIQNNNIILLSMYIKTDSLWPGGYSRVKVVSGPNLAEVGSWESSEISNGFQWVEIPLNTSFFPGTVQVVLESGTYLGPLGYEGYSETVFDDMYFVVDISGVNDPDGNSGIRIFPNPCSDVLQWTGPAGIQKIALLDISGRQALAFAGAEINTRLDISSVHPGVYLCQFELADGKKVTQKVIKQ